MRGKATGLAIVVLALLLLATPGLAAGGMGSGHGQDTTVFALQGCISSIDYDEETIVVDVHKSKANVDLPQMPIYTSEDTRFFLWTDEDEDGVWTQEPIVFSQLNVNDPVSVNGTIVVVVVGEEEQEQLWATRVTVNPDCLPFTCP